MKKILIPTDFSEYALDALKYSIQLFKQTKCNFYLLHVSDFINRPTSQIALGDNGDHQIQEEVVPSKEQLNDLLRVVEKTFSHKKHNFFGIHEHGFFLESIRKNLEEKKIDLIVMGTKGVTGLRKRIIGSNTGDVITKIQCNTLIIPKVLQFSSPKEIAFPTDYNIFYSHNILKAITEILNLGKSDICVMNVSKAGMGLSQTQQRNHDYLQDYLKESFPDKNSFHTITNKRVNAAIQCFVESRDIDMIIMAAKNLNFLQQMLFDTLVEKISFHTTVPFYVIHE